MKKALDVILRLLRAILCLFCTPRCLVCRCAIDSVYLLRDKAAEARLCPTCTKLILTDLKEQCPHCASSGLSEGESRPWKSIVDPSRTIPRCPHCFTAARRVGRVVALGNYDKQLRQLVLRTKNDYSGQVAIVLAELLYQSRGEILRQFKPDLIVPVPMHSLRYYWRGTCAPLLMADVFARRFNVPVFHGVKRARYTQLQWELNYHERRKNLRDAFVLVRGGLLCRRFPSLEGKRILIVDDIVTTGTTCHEIARLLKAAGAAEIMIATFARAIGYRHGRKMDEGR